MTAAQRNRLRELLEALRTELNTSGPKKIEPTRRDPAQTGVADEDEQALTEMLQILASTQNKKQADIAGKVERALHKLRETPDEFGECEGCGDDISYKRLELMPYATLCIECQGASDPRRGSSRRSLTDFKD